MTSTIIEITCSTLMHEFVENPVHCRLTNYSLMWVPSIYIDRVFWLNQDGWLSSHHSRSMYKATSSTYYYRYGKTNCSWASCREGCTAQIYKCHQIRWKHFSFSWILTMLSRVTYTPKLGFKNGTFEEDIAPADWANLRRTEKLVIIQLFQALKQKNIIV